MPEKCATCPFREGSPYAHLKDYLCEQATTASSRVCHSTGKSVFYGQTGKPERLCRGARDVQLKMFHSMGFLSEPTDACWAKKVEEMGIG